MLCPATGSLVRQDSFCLAIAGTNTERRKRLLKNIEQARQVNWVQFPIYPNIKICDLYSFFLFLDALRILRQRRYTGVYDNQLNAFLP